MNDTLERGKLYSHVVGIDIHQNCVPKKVFSRVLDVLKVYAGSNNGQLAQRALNRVPEIYRFIED